MWIGGAGCTDVLLFYLVMVGDSAVVGTCIYDWCYLEFSLDCVHGLDWIIVLLAVDN
jgi:hypothetical protein